MSDKLPVNYRSTPIRSSINIESVPGPEKLSSHSRLMNLNYLKVFVLGRKPTSVNSFLAILSQTKPAGKPCGKTSNSAPRQSMLLLLIRVSKFAPDQLGQSMFLSVDGIFLSFFPEMHPGPGFPDHSSSLN